jgi:hypothetical protein
VFIFLGVAGSALGTVVLLGTYLRYKFLSHFLVCLNVSSAAFLLTVFTSWLADNGIDVFGVPGLCQVRPRNFKNQIKIKSKQIKAKQIKSKQSNFWHPFGNS